MDTFYPKPLQSATNSPLEPQVPATPSLGLKPQKATPTPTLCSFALSGRCKYGNGCKFIHPDSSKPSTPPIGSSAANWRLPSQSIGPHSPHNGHEHSPINKRRDSLSKTLPKKENIPDGHIPVNKDQHRLDAYVPEPTPEAETRLKERSASHRLCNAKHVAGRCDNPSCEYDHRPLEEDLKPVLEWLSRSLPCAKRGACRNTGCTSGHICQKGPSCKYRGGKAYCKLGWHCHIDDLTVHQYVPASIPGPVGRLTNNGDDDYISSGTPISEDDDGDGASIPLTSNGFSDGNGA